MTRGAHDHCSARLAQINPAHVKLEKRIGQGAFGEVWIATFRGSDVAVKRLLSHRQGTNRPLHWFPTSLDHP